MAPHQQTAEELQETVREPWIGGPTHLAMAPTAAMEIDGNPRWKVTGYSSTEPPADMAHTEAYGQPLEAALHSARP